MGPNRSTPGRAAAAGEAKGFAPGQGCGPIRHPVIWYVFAGSRGGYSRARVVRALQERPLNTHQLAKQLDLDYTTVAHHLRVLEQNGLVHGLGPKYGRAWFLTDKMEAFSEAFATIWEKLEGKTPGQETEDG